MFFKFRRYLKIIPAAILLCIFTLSYSSNILANTITATSMIEVKSKVLAQLHKNKPEDILVIFDVNTTLIRSIHPAASYAALNKHEKSLQNILKDKSAEEKDLISTLLYTTNKQKLIEKETAKIIKSLQNKKFKLMGVTSLLSGKFTQPNNKYIYQIRNQLQKLGIDFKISFKNLVHVVSFTQKFPMYANGYPTFYWGILSTNGEHNPHTNKGKVLTKLLEQMNNPVRIHKGGITYKPKMIIFVDGKTKNVKIVEQHLKEKYPKIEFLGIHYENNYSEDKIINANQT